MSIAYYVISLAGKTFSNPWLGLPTKKGKTDFSPNTTDRLGISQLTITDLTSPNLNVLHHNLGLALKPFLDLQ
jgi:hypothetical protein